MSGEVCWGVGGDQGSCEKRCGGGVGKCFGVWGEIRKDVWGVEKCGRVYGVSGEGGKRVYGERKCVGVWERMWGGVGKCVRVWGPNTLPHTSFLTFPYISPYLPHTPTHFPTPPSSHISPHTPTHFPTIPTSPSPSQSVAKLPCDEVSVAKLLRRSYHVAKLLATESTDRCQLTAATTDCQKQLRALYRSENALRALNNLTRLENRLRAGSRLLGSVTVRFG